VQGARLVDSAKVTGVNDRVQLAAAARTLNRYILERHMRAGVTIVDPATTWIDTDVRIGRDAVVRPGVQLLGTTVIGEDAEIGPDSTLVNSIVGDSAKVIRTHGDSATIGARATVGPFSYLRPGTVRRYRQSHQGPAPHLYRRRHYRRPQQYRSIQRFRELRRGGQTPHARGIPCADRQRYDVRRTGDRG
jgi:bifunctional N-acetylglucosamine-1-phosphate-uridyltransferase/glucosamine-1-phosphate-acetyltransferase GlmU-like protein